MTKQQKEIIITIVLLFIFIPVFSSSLKKMKSAGKGRRPAGEITLKEEAITPALSPGGTGTPVSDGERGTPTKRVGAPGREESPGEAGGISEAEGGKKESQLRLIPQIKLKDDWGRDPFTLPRETIEIQSILRSVLKEEDRLPGPVTGIVWKEGGPLCLIGDDIVRIGDTVQNYSVTGIDKSRVTLQKEGKTYELFLEEE